MLTATPRALKNSAEFFRVNPFRINPFSIISDDCWMVKKCATLFLSMNNQEIARILRRIAAAYILKNENRFKIIAYEKAADIIDKSTIEVKDLWEAGKLNTLPGIGMAIASHLGELFKTGQVKHFRQVLQGLPQALFPLLDVSGFGPKKAFKLVTSLKLKDPNTVVSDLLEAAYANKIAGIPSFGQRSQQDIIESLERFKRGLSKAKRMPLSYAYAIADEVIDYLKEHQDTIETVPLGSLRRMVATIGDIDIAVSTNNPQKIIEYFINYPKKKEIVEKGPSGATILLGNGTQIDLRVQSPVKFGAMLQYFTGSKLHNIHLREFALKKGLSLSEYGIKTINKSQISQFSDEKSFYKAIGLPWIPPEIREDTGEIEAALQQVQSKPFGLPDLVGVSDIKGDFHIHSNYNLEPSHDLGASSLEDILSVASELGYEYIGISDHNPSYTNHLKDEIISILKRRKQYFEQILLKTKSVRVNLFFMLEVDILPDGTLPLPKKAYDYLDAIIVSVHSSFHLDKAQMTKRIISGLSYPKAKILGHPTGRLIGEREGYEVDWSRVMKFCQQNNKALEINAYPDRLDLPDNLVREAIKYRIKLAIDTDSHEMSQLRLMRYGVSVARRGWATKDDIINTLSYNKARNWLLTP